MQAVTSSPFTSLKLNEEKNLVVTWEQFEVKHLMLGAKILSSGWIPDAIIGIGRGGWAVADALSRILDVSSGAFMCKSYLKNGACEGSELKTSDGVAFIGELKGRVLVVDDLVEKGATLKFTNNFIKMTYNVDVKTAVVFRKSKTEFEPSFFVDDVEHDRWILLPGEIYERLDISQLSQEDLHGLSLNPELAVRLLGNLPLNPREKMSPDKMKWLLK